ncbi:alpha/beta hydrolase [Jidongwangia harbinensis]|uniref:alpha/beta hydrolase n=1 Tax=Jidongwangia harbinensis TaxID=2878561 RepID=UPI001CD92EF4|nr:alpha/beta hydrolase [Jidongwangia harbinensis]MCA2218628.1 alpha/beta hydrolase family protein [Jidongwangia harbinensis]
MTAVTYARLRAADPGRWRAAALDWRQWAAAAGRWTAELAAHLARVQAVWTGAAAASAAARIRRLRCALDRLRLLCWEADQTLSEFAAVLVRARALLARATEAAARAGQVIRDDGSLPRAGAAQAAGDLATVLRLAAAADAAATRRLAGLAELAAAPGGTAPPVPPAPLPPPTAAPAEVRRWWDGLSPAQRHHLVATEPARIGPRDGIPAADRDLANRLLLDQHRAGLDRAMAHATGRERRRLGGLRDGLDDLERRLVQAEGPRGYLLALTFDGEGGAVVALGDPDRADHVLTHVPGMTADLASYRPELARAERVAVRATELAPAAGTSAVLWLGYDAPDFVDEAAGRGLAEAGAAGLRGFQDGLRATHHGDAGHLTVLGHSYGSLVVGSAATGPGLQADDVVFVGSPGVGVDSVRDLAVPPDRVWAGTARSDVVQYAAVSARSLLEDLVVSRALPVAGPVLAFGLPEDDLWHGRNPADPAFGARVFGCQPGAGHTGYWEPGGPALDALAGITVRRGPS